MVLTLIDSKLISDAKNLWLFSVGKNLNSLVKNHWQAQKKKEIFDEIRLLLYSPPSNISPFLIKKLENLTSEQNKEVFDENIIELSEKLYALGN